MGWLRYWPQFLVFLVAYGIEVQVKAAQPLEPALVSEPEGCHRSLVSEFDVQGVSKSQERCLIGVSSSAEAVAQLKIGSALLSLSPGAQLAITRAEESLQHQGLSLLQFRPLGGEILIALEERGELAELFFELVTEYGGVRLQAGSEVIVLRDGRKWVELSVLKGQAQSQLKGHEAPWVLPQGFYFRFGPVDSQGLVQVDLPQPLVIKNSLRRWSSLHAFDKQLWWTKAQAMIPIWLRAVEASAQWQQSKAERQIASVEAERLRRERIREENRRKDEGLRRLFRQKNYLE